ncbi:hypothetical protein FNV43_RR00848 [Rhamnella rubrinervis]|uniref:Cullin N-terminal domain-containing protein n=1 Tax=Rhamnella rubrinervis TaxID=2594499 RepID=A0A8K0HQC5_9ROSA|nr:hypothetical protein FNV43_RR00848 [Rhamnella rubrinervis]
MTFEEGYLVLQGVVDRVINMVEGANNQKFTSDEYMEYYAIVFDLSKPGPRSFENSKQLYDLYDKSFKDYIAHKVLPSLRGKEDGNLLQELERRWSNHKTMIYWLSRFFGYLDRYFTTERKLPSLKEISFLSFYELVFGEMNNQIRDAVISMIDREREGEQIDQALVKNILAIYMEFGMDSSKYYTGDFEEAMLKDSAAFYSHKASNWISTKPYEDYMLKVEGCLKHERNMASQYLPPESQQKLLEVVEHELLVGNASELQEKKKLDEFISIESI